ncbi:unnamed protein product [Effrenium voratum]|nr:unnamed protein product [Effrenium voratum]
MELGVIGESCRALGGNRRKAAERISGISVDSAGKVGMGAARESPQPGAAGERQPFESGGPNCPDATLEALNRSMSEELEGNLLRALEMGVQKAAGLFSKHAAAEIKHCGQNVTESEATQLASLITCGFSAHTGYHSNTQIISHLMHLVVQLALFPRPSSAATGIQVNSRSAFSEDQAVQAGAEGQPVDKGAPAPAREATLRRASRSF